MKKSFSVWFCLMVFASVSVAYSQQGDFFFSFDEGGPNMDQTRTYNVGDSGSFWVYWSTNGPADSDLREGAFIDIMSSNSGVIAFTAAETFDYEFTVAGIPVGITRLNGEGVGPVPDNRVTDDFIDEMAGFTVTGDGIIEDNGPFLDLGYDATSDGFQWGRIDFDVVGHGVTTINGSAGSGGIVNQGQLVDAQFTNLTIATSIVPEPTTFGLLIGCLSAAMARRGRGHGHSAEMNS